MAGQKTWNQVVLSAIYACVTFGAEFIVARASFSVTPSARATALCGVVGWFSGVGKWKAQIQFVSAAGGAGCWSNLLWHGLRAFFGTRTLSTRASAV